MIGRRVVVSGRRRVASAVLAVTALAGAGLAGPGAGPAQAQPQARASGETVDVTAQASVALLSQAFTANGMPFCNAIWVARVPALDRAQSYSVQVHDTRGATGGNGDTDPFPNDAYFDGNVTWNAPVGMHQIGLSETFGHDCPSALANEAGRMTLVSASEVVLASFVGGPARLMDTRPGTTTVDGQFAAIGLRTAGSVTHLTVAGRAGLPKTMAAAELNVTASDAQAPGFVTVWPCDQAQPNASNLNVAPGSTVANAVLAPLAADGTVCLYTSTPVHLIVDVGGSLSSTDSYLGLSPARLLDTRPGAKTADGQQAGAGIRAPGSTTVLPVAGRAGVSTGAAAVSLNVTATGTTGAGFVTVWPCDQTRPLASTLDYGAGASVANLVIAKLAADGTVCLYTSAGAHLVVDANGEYTAAVAYAPLTPARLADSRAGATTVDGRFAGDGIHAARSTTHLLVAGRGGVPAGATAVTLNITATEPTGPGFVTVWPCDQTQPLASTLNYAAGDTVANLSITTVAADGSVCLYTEAAAHLVVDVDGARRPTA
jgi:hypothetical protein